MGQEFLFGSRIYHVSVTMHKDFDLINDEVEALVEGVDETNWTKAGVFLDDDEFCK